MSWRRPGARADHPAIRSGAGVYHWALSARVRWLRQRYLESLAGVASWALVPRKKMLSAGPEMPGMCLWSG